TLKAANGITGQLGLARTVALAINGGGNVQLQNSNGLQLGNVTASGTLSLTADGTITQRADTTIVAAGATLATSSGNDITLANAGNDFDRAGGAATLTVTSGRNLSLTDANALQLGYMLPSGTLSLTAGGNITQAGGTGIFAADTMLAAGGNIILTNAGN